MRAAIAAVLVFGCGGMPATGTIEDDVTVCGVGPTVKGIDVAFYQGTIDWASVRGAGVEFAFIRVSDGTGNPDSKFAANWSGSRAAGVLRGAYQYFRPNEDPIAQADLLLGKMGTLQPGDLPPTLDVETASGLSSTAVATAVRAWVAHVKAATGRDPIIYTGRPFWDGSVNATDLGTLPLWHAQYTSASCPDISATWSKWDFWQYTDAGTVAGISGGVDTNRWNGDRASLDAFIGSTVGSGSGSATSGCAALPAGGGIIDDSDPCFTQGGPVAYMRPVSTAGYDNTLVWTHATNAAQEANYGDWSLTFTEAGLYRVEAYTAAPWAQSKQADYQVTANGQMTSMTIDQSAGSGWQTLGELQFAAGSGQGIHLPDNTGEAPSANVQLVFDAVRVTRLDAGSGSGSGSDTGSGSGSGSGSDQGNPATGGGIPMGTGCAAGGDAGGLGLTTALLGLALQRRRRAR